MSVLFNVSFSCADVTKLPRDLILNATMALQTKGRKPSCKKGFGTLNFSIKIFGNGLFCTELKYVENRGGFLWVENY